jgi:hypothetical protein
VIGSVIARSRITSSCGVGGASIQIALQNHLSCHLIDVTAGVSGLLTCVTQCPVSCDSSQALVPGNHRAWQDGTQFFDKLKNFGRCNSNLAVHLMGNAGYDVIDFSFADDFGDTRQGLLVCWDGLKRMRKQLQLIRYCCSDARPTKIESHNWFHRVLAHCSSGGSLPIRFLIFSASCR